jgi:nitrile hydratase accessory protein
LTAPEAPFDDPWQAQLFALTVALNEAGAFSWREWTETFGARVRDAEAADYWTIWSDALVTLLERKRIAQPGEIAALAERWRAAARATPHGQPIRLEAAKGG